MSQQFNGEAQKSGETFLRFAFINMLLDIVYRSRNPRVILDGLKVVCQDNFAEDQEQVAKYKERMYEETLFLVTEGLFSLVQICEAVIVLSNFYSNDKMRSLEMADKLWAGIIDKAGKELNAKTMSSVFSTLPHLRSSRDLVLKLLSSKVGDHWQEYTTRDILEMLRVLNHIGPVHGNGSQKAILPMITEWLSVNVHKLSEQELLAVVICMNKLDFVNKKLIQTLERYMKVRGVQIKEKDLVAAICDYCRDFRIRSRPLLEAGGEYFIAHANDLSTPQVNSIARLFGELDFHPPNGFKFWDKLEHVLEHKFVEFPPKEIISLLLSFIYIEKFPLNFVRKIFNPYFMDQIHSQTEADITFSRSQLKLFDISLKQECDHYTGECFFKILLMHQFMLQIVHRLLILLLVKLAGCCATLRVFTEKNPKTISNKKFQKKLQKKYQKIKKKVCLNSYACNIWSGCE
jgi:hypothetical protein